MLHVANISFCVPLWLGAVIALLVVVMVIRIWRLSVRSRNSTARYFHLKQAVVDIKVLTLTYAPHESDHIRKLIDKVDALSRQIETLEKKNREQGTWLFILIIVMYASSIKAGIRSLLNKLHADVTPVGEGNDAASTTAVSGTQLDVAPGAPPIRPRHTM